MAIKDLRSISIFVSAAEVGSLRKAAVAMGVTPQAASLALAQLERHLDVRLFHRTTRVMSLTDEGRQFLEEAKPALRGLQRALEGAKQTFSPCRNAASKGAKASGDPSTMQRSDHRHPRLPRARRERPSGCCTA